MAAFGKHPGWNDHIDDLGLSTPELVATKRLIYVEGVAGNIDSGAWDALDAGARLEGFDHLFAWRLAGSQVLAGAMWSSSDGKGRKRYPMVVCAQLTGVGLAWALHEALPVLMRLRAECPQADTADRVRSLIDRSRAGLQAQVSAAEAQTETLDPAGLLRALAARPELGPDGLGLVRIMYQCERELPAYRTPKSGIVGRSSTFVVRPQHLRVPLGGDSPEQGLVTWHRFMLTQVDRMSPVLAIVPVGQSWVDLIVGEPTPAQFFCLRAAPKTMPLGSDIPYSLDPEFVARAVREIGA
ncbi:MAG: hypothetical protein JNM80_05465 [Phycisphaerae bacterium]|nr:hypothetical protein [Phycisphaerae bacterium]